MTDIIFFYGTLWTRTAQPSMNALVQRCCDPIGSATIQARLYQAGGYPGAVPSSDVGDRVFGMLYELRRAERWLPQFDRYEHYDPADPAGGEYVRRELPATPLATGAVTSAWVYVYNGRTQFLQRIPHGDYSRILRATGH